MSAAPAGNEVRWVSIEFNGPAVVALLEKASELKEGDALAVVGLLTGALASAVHLAGVEPAAARHVFADSLRKAGPVVAAGLAQARADARAGGG